MSFEKKTLFTPLPSPFGAVESRTTVNCTRLMDRFHAASADSADSPQLPDPSVRRGDDPNCRFTATVPSGHLSLNSANPERPAALIQASAKPTAARRVQPTRCAQWF